MNDASPLKKDWTVSQSAFDRMLDLFDSDRERAGERYELVRQKLVKFFQWRNCPDPEAFADRTIDRVARRLEEGSELEGRDPYLFFHGTAINVMREHWKASQKTGTTSIDDLGPSQSPSEDPHEVGARREERVDKEVKLECLNQCISGLPLGQVEMIQQYHQSDGGTKIAQRKALAEQLGVPLNALRIRMYRLRQELETCILNCSKGIV